MSRSGYSSDYGDDSDYPCAMDLYRSSVNRAVAGKRGQAFFRALIVALDAMPVRELIPEDIACPAGVCALGAAIRHWRPEVPATEIHPEDHKRIGKIVNVAPCLVAEVEYENDKIWDDGDDETPSARWIRMRAWAENKITAEAP